MKSRILILVFFLISNLSFSQTDSLIGKKVTIHFNETKETVTGEYKGYKNNRVTVLFDNSLHDYFHPEIKFLEFEGLNLRFDENGKIIIKKIYFTENTPSMKNKTNKERIKEGTQLIVSEKFGNKSFALNQKKMMKITLKNGKKIKSKYIKILDNNTLAANGFIIKLTDIKAIKGQIQTSIGRKIVGNLVLATGVIATASVVFIYYGVGAIMVGRMIKGHHSYNFYDKWKLEVI